MHLTPLIETQLLSSAPFLSPHAWLQDPAAQQVLKAFEEGTCLREPQTTGGAHAVCGSPLGGCEGLQGPVPPPQLRAVDDTWRMALLSVMLQDAFLTSQQLRIVVQGMHTPEARLEAALLVSGRRRELWGLGCVDARVAMPCQCSSKPRQQWALVCRC